MKKSYSSYPQPDEAELQPMNHPEPSRSIPKDEPEEEHQAPLTTEALVSLMQKSINEVMNKGTVIIPNREDELSANESILTGYAHHTPAEMKFCARFLDQLEEKIWLHNQSAEHYERLNLCFLVPSVLITGVSGIASFMATSSSVPTGTQVGFSFSVGVMASMSTILQSFSGAFGFQTRAEAHRNTAEEYQKLYTKVNFELAMPNEKDFLGSLEAKMLDIQNKCKYLPPIRIVDAFHRHRQTLRQQARALAAKRNKARLAKNDENV